MRKPGHERTSILKTSKAAGLPARSDTRYGQVRGCTKPEEGGDCLGRCASRRGRRLRSVGYQRDQMASLSFFESLFRDELTALSLSDSCASLLDLPAELIHHICKDLAKADIKRLRLVCRRLAGCVDLRIERVYLSPNRANLETFNNILSHARWKRLVREIVWDDAYLSHYGTVHAFRKALNEDPEMEDEIMSKRLYSFLDLGCGDEERTLEFDDFFENGQLTEFAKGVLLSQRNDRHSRNIIAKHCPSRMTIEASYDLHQRLHMEETHLVATGEDARALRVALSSFPNLKRITLTSEVWRPWFNPPIYDSPFFRSLPPGFRKPNVWPWLGFKFLEGQFQRDYRQRVMSRHVDELPSEWRGYSIIVAALLAVPNHRVNEFVIDVQGEELGISHQLFSSRNETYDRTLEMMSAVPLRRFELALNIAYARWDDFACFNNGLMRQAFERMTCLEHFEFSANYSNRGKVELPAPISLQTFLPASDCAFRHLKYFGLRNFVTTEDSLVALLQSFPALSSTLLDNVRIPMPRTYLTLLHRLRRVLVCNENASWKSTQPHLVYCERSEHYPQGTLNRIVYDEVDEFLYRGGECPFEDTGRISYDSHTAVELRHGIGWEVDERDPSYKVRHGEKGVFDRVEAFRYPVL